VHRQTVGGNHDHALAVGQVGPAGVVEEPRARAPRAAAGIIALVVSAFQYRATLRYLWHGDFAAIAGVGKAPGSTPVYAIAIGLTLIGVFAFAAVLVRAV
jgi:putative membrane protein